MIRATVLAMIPARLFHEVLALPPEERREFALRVLETIEDPAPGDIEEAHYQEVLRRVRDIDEGREQLIPWEEIKHELFPPDDEDEPRRR